MPADQPASARLTAFLRQRPAVAVGGIAVIAVVLVALILAGSGSGRSDVAGSTSSSGDPLSGAPSTTVPTDAASSSPVSIPADKAGTDLAGLNLDFDVSDTSHLHNGDPVTVKVKAHDGQLMYGFYIRLCRANETYTVDPDIRPSETGKCADKALAPDTDFYQEVKGNPDNLEADTTFKVGAGTTSYRLRQTGEPKTVTCGPGSPCVLVLKLEYPNGIGYKVIPLNFA